WNSACASPPAALDVPHHGRSVGESGRQGPTLQLQRDEQREQVHHPDVGEHH
ncbi:6,7-dimethyl-8-ribityllumazine synthase 2, partial [Clarias magur]